ncbi:MAG: hypothetical protein KGH75_05560 [Rhodospirillales bacterium]|nr:hypothetical protein [Rhodospirillales bacterium]
MLKRLRTRMLSVATLGAVLCLPAYADISMPPITDDLPTDTAITQRALADAIGKPDGGYYYTNFAVQYTDGTDPTVHTNHEKILWLPWGVVKVTVAGVENDVVFLKGFDTFTVNCHDPYNENGVCFTGGNADQAQLKAVVYKIVNGQPVLAGAPATLNNISTWSVTPASGTVSTNDLGNGYTGIFYQTDEGGQGVSSVFDVIYLLQNGVVADGGSVPVSGNNVGMVDPKSPSAYSYTSSKTFADAGPGQPDSIIVTFKGTAPLGKEMAPVSINKTAVYSDSLGNGYSGFNPNGE